MAVRGVDPFFSPPGGGTPPELETIRAESGAVVESILKDAAASGEIPAENLPVALELLAVLIYGALMRRAQQPDPGPAGSEAQQLAAAFLWGVAGR
jgi:hypothetical protein